jgi:hypothetical protein
MCTDIHREDGTLVVRMPAPRALAQALIAVSWLPFIAAGIVVLVIVGQGFRSAAASGGVPAILLGLFFIAFALFVLGAALAGFAGALYGLLGREVARVEDGSLTLERVLFGARVRQRYDGVRDLRLAKPEERKRRWTAPPPKVLFEADGERQGFGAGLTDEEAAEVLRALQEALARPKA